MRNDKEICGSKTPHKSRIKQAIKNSIKQITMEKTFLSVMDRFFTFLLLLSGEEDLETVSIEHIL